ncbi:MAG: ABC transporter substrate-binding protein [Clostridia bacterium]|nr:ABC transporter substrate-binding protein [Clostridia bacterium]
MKRLFSFLFILILCLSMVGTVSAAPETIVLNVYNWGEYISDGSEGTMNVNAEFEKYYERSFGQKVRVNYTTYASNEDMYNKLSSGAAVYDVIIPSDYMIQRMITEDMLRPLDFSNIPNYRYIDPNYTNLYYDPDNLYSIPYTYGMVGIIYNTSMVDAEDITDWDCMWNKKYAGKILQFNNPRDGMATAMFKLGVDINTTDKSELRAVTEELKKQKPLIQSYVMDEIFNKMKTGSAAIAPYYAGDFLAMYESNEALAFVYPESGTNVFVDAFCIPKISRYPDVAEAYINFMLSKEPAIANAEYLYYASPNTLVTHDEGYMETMNDIHPDAMDILYPKDTDFKTQYYHNLDADTLAYSNELWEELKIQNSIEPWILWTAGIILAFVVGLLLFKTIRSAYREKQY